MKRLFTSPLMKGSEVKLWCQMARDNQLKLTQRELEMKAIIFTGNEKAAS
ncbi:hypothetical protein [Heyndrickxia acidicola]|uniref:Uncharacterized protein n=1 Tax=Heyndrickxia acidicola TaxID=209389 RepID=A0ABU6MBU1_9BACI|nr:hypothetical protein [Heyndrickxia acidicola]MED1201980.1 hypothetical protein [Heyndrickxia acidicola]